MKVLLDKNKRFYKANLHCHSVYSDGTRTVDELKSDYMSQGYSIIAFTDHEHLIDNSRLTDENFLAITACELALKEFPKLSSLAAPYMRVCHLNIYALEPHNVKTPCYCQAADHYIKDEYRHLLAQTTGDFDRTLTAENVNEVIRTANEQGFLVSYNHPGWSLENAEHYFNYEGLFAVEIYNHGCRQNWRGDDEHVYDDLLRQGKKLYCTACDDNHGNGDPSNPYGDTYGGWICVNADKLEYSTVMQALKKGEFYASIGPQIFSLVYENNTVSIKTSPCKKIDLVTRGRRAKAAIAPKGESLHSAQFSLQEDDCYFRLRVVDNEGKTAWTQAYYLEDLYN